MKVGIIGGGKVGSCLAEYLKAVGQLSAITGSSAEHSKELAEKFADAYCDNNKLVELNDVILITVPDRSIGTVTQAIAKKNISLQ